MTEKGNALSLSSFSFVRSPMAGPKRGGRKIKIKRKEKDTEGGGNGKMPCGRAKGAGMEMGRAGL